MRTSGALLYEGRPCGGERECMRGVLAEESPRMLARGESKKEKDEAGGAMPRSSVGLTSKVAITGLWSDVETWEGVPRARG